MEKKICRMCKSKNLKKFLDLGSTAMADNFLTKQQLKKHEKFFPLAVNFCKNCGLCQLSYVVPPKLMFNDSYIYDSSTTKTGRKHFISMGIELSNQFKIPPGSLAIDVGSNAGVLLSGFKSKSLRVLGIEPSSNVADIAKKNGIDTIIDFFSNKLAKKILKKYGKAAIITGTNVFAHVNDLDDFVKGCKILLDEKGVVVIEAPYLVNLINNLEYDTIYHEHLSYLSVKPMVKFFKKFDLELFDVRRQTIHGGTLRYFIGYKGIRPINKRVSKFLKMENDRKIYSEKKLKKFAKDVKNHRLELKTLLNNLRNNGKKIVGISAPAKGNTLLNYCKIGTELLDYLTEKNSLKIGKFSPGMHIPIFSDEKLLKDPPDYALILAWNFVDEIIKNNQKFKKQGGKFIIPIPKPRIV